MSYMMSIITQSHSSSTLKAQKTNCINIYKLKGDSNVKVFCSISNFEIAIGIDDVHNNKKTQTIYKILHEPTEGGARNVKRLTKNE